MSPLKRITQLESQTQPHHHESCEPRHPRRGTLVLWCRRFTHGEDSDAPKGMCNYGMCDMAQGNRALEWIWERVAGTEAGSIEAVPLGGAPPSAALCTVLFSPHYKVAFIKGTKVGGSSVMHMSGMCHGARSRMSDLKVCVCHLCASCQLACRLIQ